MLPRDEQDKTSVSDEPETREKPVDSATGADTSAPPTEDAAPAITKQWFVLKVQSNREDSIREAIIRRLKIANLGLYVGEVIVPKEKVTEIRDGKKRVVERKFYPGYIIIEMEMNDEVWFVIRETPGVGHFVGSGDKPLPMPQAEVAKMLGQATAAATVAEPRLKIAFQRGDRVKIKEGYFENFEGDVDEVNEDKGMVTVMIQIFGRTNPVELEYWKIEAV